MKDTKKTQSSVKQSSEHFLNPKILLWRQIPLRLDLAIRDFAIGEILGENNFGLSLWNKLGIRTAASYRKRIRRLEDLIKSFKKYGYKNEYFFTCDRNWIIRNGAHRIVLCLRYNTDIIRVKRYDGNHLHKHPQASCFNNYLLLQYGYTHDEINIIWDRTNELYRVSEETAGLIETERKILRKRKVLSELGKTKDRRTETNGE